jgi:hypothetical protein
MLPAPVLEKAVNCSANWKAEAAISRDQKPPKKTESPCPCGLTAVIGHRLLGRELPRTSSEDRPVLLRTGKPAFATDMPFFEPDSSPGSPRASDFKTTFGISGYARWSLAIPADSGISQIFDPWGSSLSLLKVARQEIASMSRRGARWFVVQLPGRSESDETKVKTELAKVRC